MTQIACELEPETFLNTENNLDRDMKKKKWARVEYDVFQTYKSKIKSRPSQPSFWANRPFPRSMM